MNFPSPIDDSPGVARLYASISYVDHQFGLILQALRETGRLDRTMIVFTSDHGDMLGERGLWYKMTWFDPSGAGPPAGPCPVPVFRARATEAVSLVDLLPTLVEATGAAFEPASPIDGRSLAMAHLHGTGGHDDATGVYIRRGRHRPARDDPARRWKFVASLPDPGPAVRYAQ